MDYFLLKSDERYTNIPMLVDVFQTIDKRNINLLNAHKIENTIVFYAEADKETNFIDVLDRQLYLISKNLKKLIEKYTPNTIFKLIPIIDTNKERQETYYLPIFEEIEALSDKSEFNLDKSVIKKLVLDEEKIKEKKIFKIKEGDKTLIVVRLDVAESILRREFYGVELERVEVDENRDK